MDTFHPLLLFFTILLTLSPFASASSSVSPNPFTAKASLLRYWTRKAPKSPPIHRPDFIVSKLSPLSAADSATYTSLAATDPISLSAHLPAFCAAAHLLCNPKSNRTGSRVFMRYRTDSVELNRHRARVFNRYRTDSHELNRHHARVFNRYHTDSHELNRHRARVFNRYRTDSHELNRDRARVFMRYRTDSDELNRHRARVFNRYRTDSHDLNRDRARVFMRYHTDARVFNRYSEDFGITNPANSSTRSKSYNKSSLVDIDNDVTKPTWAMEPGTFFRESSLKKGTIMPMPDIRDKMPSRSFLPRSISTHFSSSPDSVLHAFNLAPETAMGKAIMNTMSECVSAPNKGETKRCAMSAEDMIDFSVSILGDSAVVRSTESARGSGENVVVGDVEGVDGGRLTKSVSCHQSLFPYLVYYCHSVPKVRLYEVEILAIDSKEKINHGVAICHIDTSEWSAGHDAFVALGSGPGKIEVCHWIYPGDMVWTS